MRWFRVRRGRRAAACPTWLLLALGAACILLAACGPATWAAPGAYYPVIRTPVSEKTPTPQAPTYSVGAWPSDSTPGTDGTVVIYVAFHHVGTPAAGARVTLAVRYPNAWKGYGPALTDVGGYAALRVSYADPFRGRPVQVTVRVTYQGQTYLTTTSFTPR
jgi:hypothetical protein